MHSLNFNYQQKPFEKTIQLYGDRAGGQGNFEFAGLAEIQKIQFVVLKGNPQSLQQPADWRRYLRLLHLAQRIHKPVLLWNLPLAENISVEKSTSLDLGTVVKTTKLQLLRLPQPIILVYNEIIDFNDVIQGMRWGDGSIVVKPEKGVPVAAFKPERKKLKVVCKQADIPIQLLKMLNEISKISIEELVAKRFTSFSLHTEVQY